MEKMEIQVNVNFDVLDKNIKKIVQLRNEMAAAMYDLRKDFCEAPFLVLKKSPDLPETGRD